MVRDVYKYKKNPPEPAIFSPGSEIPIFPMLCTNLCKKCQDLMAKQQDIVL
jgi:hypothetical protein